MSINYGAASSFAIVASNYTDGPGTVTGNVAYNTGLPPTFNPTVGGGTVSLLTPAINAAINAAINQINGLPSTYLMNNNDLNTEFGGNTLDITATGTNVYTATNLTNSAPFTIIGGLTDYAVFRVTGTILFGYNIFASYPQNVTFIASSDVTITDGNQNGKFNGTYISDTKVTISGSTLVGRAISIVNVTVSGFGAKIYLPGFLQFPQITLGLAENYAILGNTYLNFTSAGTVKGFMGSDFLSYAPVPGVDSNGIVLASGSIPNAPIVNGAAAKQAIDDVNTAIPLYQAVTPVNNIIGPVSLNSIITGPGCYNISGNLTTNADVTLTGTGIYVFVFNVTGFIDIPNFKNTSLSGGLLPQNVIFIASGYIIVSCDYTTNGIYISTGDYALNGFTPLIGRLISINSYAQIINAPITAPQFA